MTRYVSVWDKRDKQDFHDKRLRASSISGLRFEGPTELEWDYEDNDESVWQNLQS